MLYFNDQRLRDYFESRNQRGILTYHFTEDCDEQVKDLVRELHEGMLPDNTIFALVVGVIDVLDDYEDQDYDDGSYLDSLQPDVYFYDLNNWARLSIARPYLDEALQDHKWDNYASLLMFAQYQHLCSIAQELINFCN